MNSLVASRRARPFSESQKTALLTLLTDDDPQIYRLVRGEIIALGQPATDWLRSYSLCDDPVLRRRTREIVAHFERQDADNEFLAFCLSHGDDLDLERGCWLLAKTQHPDINVEAYAALLDSFAGDLLEQIDFGGEDESILAEINDYLYVKQGFAGNERNYYDPDNSYLNRVVDRRTGNPISMCMIYLFVARRLRLPVTGIGMPGHFVCRFQSSRKEYYIDAFNRGRLLSKADCIRYLQRTAHDYHEKFLSPISPGRTLLRICANLHQIYVNLERVEERARAQRYIVALSK